MKTTSKIRAQDGAAMVEFALVSLLVLIPLLFIIIEGSLILYNQAMITNASREGAREAIVFDDPRLHEVNIHPDRPADRASITLVVQDYCQDHLITFGGGAPAINAEPDECPEGTATGDTITVTVTYRYDFLVLPSFLTDLIGLDDLSATTVMRCE